ncbi:unnamed protein product [Urochloa decumbens]|uniref:F-box domain-containing protein n=1 Tax=Urochloa decumbens TaxID=240449 RepID=A0ABC9D4H2_9POAL
MPLVAAVRSNTGTHMARAGIGKTPMEAQLAAAADLPEDIHAEILARLPAKSVLRFRSVCKAWRRITTDPRFLAAHARLRPAEVVLYMYLDSALRENRPPGYAINISGEQAGHQRLVRYPEDVTDPPGPWSAIMPQHCLLLASCDGVLLFATKDAGSYLLCNPVTRQWTALPKLNAGGGAVVSEYAFYFHEASGEHRLLCGHRSPAAGVGRQTAWWVLSTGAAGPRRLVDTHGAAGLGVRGLREDQATPVALHGRLHWPPRPDALRREVVAFDAAAETFHAMAGPRVAAAAGALIVKLFAMDGLLVAADFGEAKHVDLWFLADYGAADRRWECRHRVAMLPWVSGWNPFWLSTRDLKAAAGDDRGNVMLANQHGFCVYSVRTKTLRRVSCVPKRSNNLLVSRHVFRESLVQHPGFRQARSSADLPLIHFWR